MIAFMIDVVKLAVSIVYAAFSTLYVTAPTKVYVVKNLILVWQGSFTRSPDFLDVKNINELGRNVMAILSGYLTSLEI